MSARRGVRSAGLLLWRRGAAGLEVLLGHPGGPLFARRDAGVWSVPKGEHAPDEAPLAAALREFAEELGLGVPPGEPVALGEVVLQSGKTVAVWALEADLEVGAIVSSPFTMQWPPRSGREQSFPELDRAQWFGLEEAAVRLTPSQVPFLARLAAHASSA